MARFSTLHGAIVAVSAAALAIAWTSEVWGGLDPCVLCIYQRYAYAVALIIGLVGLATNRRSRIAQAMAVLAGLAFLGGAAIAAFHVGVEQQWWRGTAACHAPALDPTLSIDALREQMLSQRFVACDQVAWSLFGVSMAGYNFLVSLALAAVVPWAAWRIPHRRPTA